jgi:hypothetical protein
MLAACARQREPAQMMIGEIDATISAAGEDAAKFAPDQLSDVQTKLAALKSSFGNQDYEGVLAAAPPARPGRRRSRQQGRGDQGA